MYGKYDSLISTDAGLITGNFYQIPNRAFVPQGLWQTSCDSQNTSLLGSNLDVIQGSSIGFSLNHSLYATIGEFCERYCASFELNDNFVLANYNEMLDVTSDDVLSPSSINPYADWQYNAEGFPYQRFTADDKITWTCGIDLASAKKIWLPAFLTYLPHNIALDGKKEFILGTSTGISAGQNLTDAIEGGLLECIERDSFSNFWYNQRSLLSTIPLYNQKCILEFFKDNSKIQKLFGNNRVRLNVFDLSELGITNTMLVFLHYNYKNRTMISVGSSSRFDLSESLIKAALEAYQGIEYGILLFNNEKEWVITDDDFSSVNSFQKHFGLYNKFPELRKHIPMLNHLESSENFRNIFSAKENQISCLEDFKRQYTKGSIYVNLTTPDVKEMGLHVIRVIVPELSYLTGVHDRPFLGSTIFKNQDDLFLKYPHLFP